MRTLLAPALSALLLTLVLPTSAHAGSTILVADSDNTLYGAGGLSNGAGSYIFSGRTNQGGQNSFRRALLHFDLSGAVPDGATVRTVTLTLNRSKSRSSSARAHNLHRLTRAFGEGSDNASGQEGRGTAAGAGAATWTSADGTTDWTDPGGDFVPAASATAMVSGAGTPTWSGGGLVADVNAWLATPAENFGWILIGDETAGRTVTRFDAREATNASNRPTLTIQWDAITQLTDTTDGVDFASAPQLAGNGNAGFAAPIGGGLLRVDSATDGSVDFQLTRGAGELNDAVVIYFDTGPGGFSDTSTFNDLADGGRQAVSGASAQGRSDITFPTGFAADFGLTYTAQFGALLYELQSGGNDAHNFVEGWGGDGASSDATFTFEGTLAALGLQSGDSFSFVVTYLNLNNAFRSDEWMGTTTAAGNPGQNPVVLPADTWAVFQSVESDCGNGVIDAGEACDDGGQSAGDGCSADCSTIEEGFFCPAAGGACSACTTCGDGRYETAACTANADASCADCDDSCATCDGPAADDCLSCGAANLFDEGRCVPCESACDPGQYNEGCGGAPNTLDCRACVGPCATCTGPNNGECLSCVAEHWLDGNTCRACQSCANGQYETGACTQAAPTQCADCDASCASCDGPAASDCTACPDGSWLDNGTCRACASCNADQFVMAACSPTSDTVCGDCDASCDFCDGPGAGDCVGCPPGQWLDNGTCTDCRSCEAGSYESGACTATADTQCAPCDPGCATCGGPSDSQCTGCADGSFVSGGSCVACGACDAGSYAAGGCAGSEDTQCASCNAACAACDGPDADDCTACDAGSWLNGRSCDACSNCPAGQYASAECTTTADTQCSACDAACENCDGPTAADCVSCPAGQWSDAGTCADCGQCPDGSYAQTECAAEADTICALCDGDCATCDGPAATDCVTCPAGSTLGDDGSCGNVDSCDPNPCENGGACLDQVEGFRCQCEPGFSGDTCAEVDTEICDDDADNDDDGLEDCADPGCVADALCADEDTDGDEVSNTDEIACGTDPLDSADEPSADDLLDTDEDSEPNCADADDDGDGLDDVDEAAAGSDPLVADSDGDGLEDGIEVNACYTGSAEDDDCEGSSPTEADTDDDGLDDSAEDANGNGLVDAGESNPLLTDSDGDGADDGLEFMCDSDPTDAESLPDAACGGGDDNDSDGVSNEVEMACGTDPNDAASRPAEGDTGDTDGDSTLDCADDDDDGDGTDDAIETACGTDPRDDSDVPAADALVDTDGDGEPNCADSDDDDDGLSDTREGELGTDPLDPDSDGDGVNDGDEVDAGTDPTKKKGGGGGGCQSAAAPAPWMLGLLLAGLLRRRRR